MENADINYAVKDNFYIIIEGIKPIEIVNKHIDNVDYDLANKTISFNIQEFAKDTLIKWLLTVQEKEITISLCCYNEKTIPVYILYFTNCELYKHSTSIDKSKCCNRLSHDITFEFGSVKLLEKENIELTNEWKSLEQDWMTDKPWELNNETR